MKYQCSYCKQTFDDADECEDHENSCPENKNKKEKGFPLTLQMRCEDTFKFSLYNDCGYELSKDGEILEDSFQDEDGHDLYIVAVWCEDKKYMEDTKKLLINAMKEHLQEGINKLTKGVIEEYIDV